MVFFGLGSTTYCYLLVRSRYVPKALAVLGVGLSALALLYFLASIAFPAGVTAAVAAVGALPVVALVLLGIMAAPLLSFEVALGLWLLVKGVRIPEPRY